jgi:hypothetical protein
MHPAFPDTFKQMLRTAEPTHALRLVASRNVEDPKTESNPSGVGPTGFGNKGVARRSVQTQSILDPSEPPHRVGVGREVIGGETLRRDSVK